MTGLTAEQRTKVIILELAHCLPETDTPSSFRPFIAANFNEKCRHTSIAQGISPGSAHGCTSVSFPLQSDLE